MAFQLVGQGSMKDTQLGDQFSAAVTIAHSACKAVDFAAKAPAATARNVRRLD